MGALEKTDERLIQSFTTVWIDETLQAEHVRGWVVRFSEDYRAQDFERIVAADSDNTNATPARRSGQCNNSIVRNGHGLVDLKEAKGGGVSLGGSRF